MMLSLVQLLLIKECHKSQNKSTFAALLNGKEESSYYLFQCNDENIYLSQKNERNEKSNSQFIIY